MSDKLLVRLNPELKRLIDQAAAQEGLYGGMGELVVKILAEHFGRMDLATVPRRRAGRPRKDQELAASK